jgi:hypothetical protein
MMRTILLASLVATGIGLAATSSALAVPVNGAAIGDAATATNHLTQVQHWRWGSRGHFRFGSRGGHFRFGSFGGHFRFGSRGGHFRFGSRGRRY